MDKLILKMRAKNVIRKRLTELVGSCQTDDVPLGEQSQKIRVDFLAEEIVDALFEKKLLCVVNTPCIGDKCYLLRADGTVESGETVARIMLTKRRVYLYYFEGGAGKIKKGVLGKDIVLEKTEDKSERGGKDA